MSYYCFFITLYFICFVRLYVNALDAIDVERRKLFPYCSLFKDNCFEVPVSYWDVENHSIEQGNHPKSGVFGNDKSIEKNAQRNQSRDINDIKNNSLNILSYLDGPIVFPFFDTPYNKIMKLDKKNYTINQFVDQFNQKGLEFVQISNQKNILYFFPDMPFYQLFNRKYADFLKPCFEHVNVTSTEFKVKLNSREGNYYAYYSDQMGKGVIPESIENDVLPFVSSFFPGVNADLIQTNVWIGQSGTTARLHFDAHDNIFVQVIGKKRVTLLEPKSWSDVRLFPKLHPSDRQSQINETELKVLIEDFILSSSDQVCSPLHSSIQLPLSYQQPETYIQNYKVYITELSAGQVLYIPKYYFHSIEAIENSVNVNIWAPSEEVNIGKDIFENAMPFVDDPLWNENDEDLDLAAFYLAKYTLKSLNLTSEYVNKIIESSYKPFRDILRNVERSNFPIKKLPNRLLNQVIKHAEITTTKMQRIKDRSILEIIASNFIQGLGHWTQSTISFLESLARELENDDI